MKKREVKPFLDVETKDNIYKLSFVIRKSVKGICEDFCKYAFKNGLGSELCKYFHRNVALDGTLFKGDPSNEKFEPLSDKIGRVSMTLDEDIHEYAYQLSYAMGCSVAKVVSYAIEKSMNDYDFLNWYAKEYLIKLLDTDKCNLIFMAVERYNEEKQEEYNLISLLLYITDEYKRLENGLESSIKELLLTTN